MMQTSPFLVAQITDTHLFADDRQAMKGCRTNLSFQKVVDYLKQIQPQPDVLLLTGDLSQDETIASYEYLRSLINPLQIPTYWIPGNHDQNLSDMEKILNDQNIFPNKQFLLGNWNFILMNTMVNGKVQGRLSSEELLILEQQLQLECPAVLVLHHHPLPIGSACMDAIALENADEFFAVIDRFPQVKLVVFGHIHQVFDQMRGDVRYLGTPSSCIQLKPFSAEVTLDDIPPGLRLLTLHPDGSFETAVQRVAIATA